jgi:hypothetical protein
MIDSVFNLLLCPHRKITFPITPRRASGNSGLAPREKGTRQRTTYVVCLDCGKEFPYNWAELRIEPVSPSQRQGMLSWPYAAFIPSLLQPLNSAVSTVISKLSSIRSV